MKKWLVVLGVVAALCVASSAGAAIKSVQMVKRTGHGSATGAVDSTQFTLRVCSTTAAGDTLIPVDISDIEPGYVAPGAALGTAWYPVKVSACFPVNGKADSIYVKYRVSADGTNWSTFSAITQIGGAGSTSDLCLQSGVGVDADAANNLWLNRFVQFVILSDAGGAIPNATVWLNYFTK